MTVLLRRGRSRAGDGDGHRRRQVGGGNTVAQRKKQGGDLIEHETLPAQPGPERIQRLARDGPRRPLRRAARTASCASADRSSAELDPVDAQQPVQERHRPCSLIDDLPRWRLEGQTCEGAAATRPAVGTGIGRILRGHRASAPAGDGEEARAAGHIASGVASAGPDLDKR
jgi:hypothetical protein